MASPFTVLSGKAADKTKDTNFILVEFSPELSKRVPFGEKIVLVQSVFRMLDGTPLLPSEYYGKGQGFDWKDATCLTDKDNRGMSIDALKKETHPYYNDSYGKETASKADRPSWVVGQISYADLPSRVMSVAVDLKGSHNTLRYAESFITRSTDEPSNDGGQKGFYDKTTNPAGWKTCLLKFKVFAFCSKGLDCGTWYEGISWEFTKTHEHQKKGLPGISKFTGELEKPDKAFLDCFDLFNKKRDDGDGFVKAEHVPCK